MKLLKLATAWAGLGLTAAQSTLFAPPSDLTNLLSQRWPGASIEYKQTSICETTDGVKAWSGYVSLPASIQKQVEYAEAEFDINLFFWYFESRNDPTNAPTAMYFGGGPGYTSLDPMSGFPCNVNNDSNSTTLNEHSWNNHVNMLYVDQPVGTSFSYSTRQNGTLNVLQEGQPLFTPLSTGNSSLPETNATNMAATLDPHPLETTQNTTQQAARTIWQFAQIWFQEFPEYKTSNKEISLWGTSYGGFWSTGFMSYFIDQNDLVESGQHKNSNATVLPLGILGIGNGCIDSRVEATGYPHLAYNNTYGIQVYNQTVYEMVMQQVAAPETGCYDTADVCRALAVEGDPHGHGNNQTVNEACVNATEACSDKILGAFAEYSDRSTFDISYLNIVADVDNYFNGFFNQRWVQHDLGARVNFTANDFSYQKAIFTETGSGIVQDISLLEHVLDKGVGVALVFGDRDYKCNWIGGESISLAMNYSDASRFRQAGYADIQTSSTGQGGHVRQHGNVSFSRVFDAGHAVAAYQPQVVYEIFQRSMFGKDVATGDIDTSKGSFSTKGPLSSWSTKNKVPAESPTNECYTYLATETCTEQQLLALADGTAVIRDFIVTEPKGTKLQSSPSPESTSSPKSTPKTTDGAGQSGAANVQSTYWGIATGGVASAFAMFFVF